jgi:hypothetical protein
LDWILHNCKCNTQAARQRFLREQYPLSQLGRRAAEEIVSDLLEGDKLDNLNYESGDDREAPYTSDSWEKEEDEQVDCTIENGTPVFTSELSRQSKSSSTKTSGPART